MRASASRLSILVILATLAGHVIGQASRGSSLPLATKSPGTGILPVDQAFKFTANADVTNNVQLSWAMPTGYYLYQQKLELHASDGRLLKVDLPPAKTLADEFLGENQVYFGSLQLSFPLQNLPLEPSGIRKLKVVYQGCAQDRYCYPLVSREIALNPVK